MALNLYKNYVPTSGKRATMPFKDKTSEDLLTLEEVQKFPEYAGILADDTVLVDIDDGDQSKILLKIVENLNLKCRVIATTRGAHFLFKTNKPMSNRTHCKLAIGLTADIKGGGRASYEVLKYDGVERTVLYDNAPYQQLPKYLNPVKTNVNVHIYSMNGTKVASGTAKPNATLTLHTDLAIGEMAIVTIGEKSIKVVMK